MLVFDTYAIIEIIKGNENFEKYLDEVQIVTDFILAEVAHYFAKQDQEHAALNYVQKYLKQRSILTQDVIVKAAMFKHQNKKKKLSMADCVGYCLAESLGIKFLTGDKEFEDMNNVEFVK